MENVKRKMGNYQNQFRHFPFYIFRFTLKIMLTHIVCWKYKAETAPDARVEHIEKLRNLPNVIPDIISFDVGADVLHLDRSFDTGLVAVYPDRAALDAYTVHPAHQAVAKMGKEIAERVISVDFLSQ